jgi:tetratricopeptide (TPR) repeat protein
MTSFYLAKPLSEALVEVQLLDMNYDPLPIREKVALEEFRRRFKFVPDFRKEQLSPTEKKLSKALAQAEAHFNRQEYFSAEFEYNKALKLDEDNVRANFGVGKVYVAQGDLEKAREVFGKLTHIDAVLAEENKHIFNELGIELRRMGMFDEAISHYAKALSFVHDDENLLFNIARANFEKGDPGQALSYLDQALKMNPDLKEAQR